MLKELESEARSYREAGMTTIKMKIGLLPIELDAERVTVVRDAIGPSVGLMADADHAYKIIALTTSFGVLCIPRVWGSGV